MRGPGVGTYSTYINGAFSTDLTAKFDFLGLTQSFGGLAPDTSFGIFNAGLSGNVQYKFSGENDKFVEPTAGFAFTRAMFDGAAAPVLGLKDSNTVRVQAGARIGGSWKVNDISIDANLKSLVYSNVLAEPSSAAAPALSALTPNDQGLLRGEFDPEVRLSLANGYSVTVSGQVRFGQAIVGGAAGLNIRKQW
jgi:hypothetical protein